MIITNLIGGLGNQLFQYAAGHAAARRAGTELRVSLDMFDRYRLHQGYELSRVFAVDPLPASDAEMKTCLGPWRGRRARRMLGRFVTGTWRGGRARRMLGRFVTGTWRGGRAVFQPTVPYWSGFQNLGADVYLQGYWQSERYFAEVANELRSLLRFREPPSAVNARWIERIEGCVSVGVHVRRDDYASARNRRIYAQCTPAYYRAAMDLVLGREPTARFFAFSDDPAWTRELFADRAAIVEVLDHNRGAESYNDLRLMAQCRHNIMANSTFSWWAGWLGERPDKTVIAPERWLLPPGWDVDMVPSRWVRL
jgi:hypothetical protein